MCQGNDSSGSGDKRHIFVYDRNEKSSEELCIKHFFLLLPE